MSGKIILIRINAIGVPPITALFYHWEELLSFILLAWHNFRFTSLKVFYNNKRKVCVVNILYSILFARPLGADLVKPLLLTD